jgi:1-acyl-sn-glycerol-3-phosphate acyltransferase
VYCPNHFSYLDIPVMAATTPGFFAFVGKKSLEKIPLFGYMFKKLHIPLDRENRKSAYTTAQRAKEAIEENRSIVIFPEGRIDHKVQPGLLPFKDGPFRIAIEKQIPVVPVTIPFNWIILPDDGKYFINPGVIEVIFHEPIPTQGLTMEDIPALRQKTYTVIHNTLSTYFPQQLEHVEYTRL